MELRQFEQWCICTVQVCTFTWRTYAASGNQGMMFWRTCAASVRKGLTHQVMLFPQRWQIYCIYGLLNFTMSALQTCRTVSGVQITFQEVAAGVNGVKGMCVDSCTILVFPVGFPSNPFTPYTPVWMRPLEDDLSYASVARSASS